MEEDRVVLSSLEVKKLYDHFDYDVKFNRDVTFLFGSNGCGKTTILNIITAIITGNLYKLFSFKFESLCLGYYDDNKGDIQNISISLHENGKLIVSFKGSSAEISQIPISDEMRRRGEAVGKNYFAEYPLLSEIRSEFNYVYLALNRAISISDEEDDYYLRFIRRQPVYMFEDCDIVEPEIKDKEIQYIENLISRRYTTATSNTARINNNFRDQILKSSLDVNVQTDFYQMMDEFGKSRINKKPIIEIKNSYIKILRDLHLLSIEEEKQYNVFFESYIKKIENLSDEYKIEQLVNIFMEYSEMTKIKKIVSIAAETEKQKAKILKPIETFLKTINEFITTSDIEKKIGIDVNGRVFFTTETNLQHLSIQYLSSGERQLLIFFANLIFGVKDITSGIFVVDEPELSLHLSWQKIFVSKTLELNSNVQLIFATHSPEIIGKYRNKSFKLVRKTVN